MKVKKMLMAICVVATFALTHLLPANTEGDFKWSRDLEASIALANKTGQPLLIVFR